MALTDAEQLRQLLGETVPAGGSDVDTMFTDEQISDFLTLAEDDVTLAAYHGWLAKAGEYANLVDTQEGSSRRSMSDLHKNAEARVKQFAGLAGVVIDVTVTNRRTVIRKIVRS